MIDSYLAGKLPTLTDIPLEEMKPGMMYKLRGAFTKNPFAKDEKAEHDAHLCEQPGFAGYAVGLLFCDRLACYLSSVALGCVSAAALGQVAVGIPCVIGGSASQGLLSFREKQQ